MRLAEFFAKVKRYDEHATVIFDRHEPIGRHRGGRSFAGARQKKFQFRLTTRRPAPAHESNRPNNRGAARRR
jgi:hypothetical protein